jgi:hypothetical protein
VRFNNRLESTRKNHLCPLTKVNVVLKMGTFFERSLNYVLNSYLIVKFLFIHFQSINFDVCSNFIILLVFYPNLMKNYNII